MYVMPPEYFHYLEERLQKLEKEHQELRRRLEEIKLIHIENLNYKIQELVVEELSGTLNIGLAGELDENLLKQIMEEKGNRGEKIHLEDLESKEANHNHQDRNGPNG